MAVVARNMDIGEVFAKCLPISMIYVGKHLVWALEEDTPIPDTDVRSCYAGEVWDDSLPWLDDDVWIL